jgi:hypothetical protein
MVGSRDSSRTGRQVMKRATPTTVHASALTAASRPPGKPMAQVVNSREVSKEARSTRQ